MTVQGLSQNILIVVQGLCFLLEQRIQTISVYQSCIRLCDNHDFLQRGSRSIVHQFLTIFLTPLEVNPVL